MDRTVLLIATFDTKEQEAVFLIKCLQDRGVAVLTIAFWSEIQLRYHRYCFRNGTPEAQLDALDWIKQHHLEVGMLREKVERVLGEPLEERFFLLVAFARSRNRVRA